MLLRCIHRDICHVDMQGPTTLLSYELTTRPSTLSSPCLGSYVDAWPTRAIPRTFCYPRPSRHYWHECLVSLPRSFLRLFLAEGARNWPDPVPSQTVHAALFPLPHSNAA